MSSDTLRFGECANLVRASTSPSLFPDSPYVALEHIDQGTLTLNGHAFGRDADSQKTRFKKGDILFGKLRPYFRKAIIAPFDGLCSTDIWAVRPQAGIDRNFLFYWMASEDFVNRATDTSEGTRMPRAKWDIVSKFKIPKRSLEEQSEIGESLRALDDRIALLRETDATLEAIAQAMFKSWFVDFDPVHAKQQGRAPEGMSEATAALFPDRFEESGLGLVPRGWKVELLETFMELSYGKALKATERIVGEVPVYGSGGITGNHNESLVNGPSIVIGRKGTVGSLYWEDRPFFPIDTVFYVRSAMPMTYCFYLLQTLGLADMNTDAAVPGLNRNNVYRLKVPKAPEAVLSAFSDVVDVLRGSIFKNNQQAQTLATLRDTLLPRLISGQLRLPQAEAAREEA